MKNFLKKINISFILRIMLCYLIVNIGGTISDKTKTIENIDNLIYVNYFLGFIVGYLVFKLIESYYTEESEVMKK